MTVATNNHGIAMRFKLATACATANAFVLVVIINDRIGVGIFLESLQNKVPIHDITVTCIFYFLSSISGHLMADVMPRLPIVPTSPTQFCAIGFCHHRAISVRHKHGGLRFFKHHDQVVI